MKLNKHTINVIDKIESQDPKTWNRRQRRYIAAVSNKILNKKGAGDEEIA